MEYVFHCIVNFMLGTLGIGYFVSDVVFSVSGPLQLIAWKDASPR